MVRILLGLLACSTLAQATPLVIVPVLGATNDINGPAYAPNASQSGVARLLFAGGGCSGAAISLTAVLTAAHCVSGAANLASASFTDSGLNTATFNVASFLVHPSWIGTGDVLTQVDLALVFLTSPLASWVSIYDLYAHTDELGQTYTVAGYGRRASGTPTAAGAQGSAGEFGELRVGDNIWERTQALNGVVRSDVLISVFNQPGNAAVAREVTVAPGDSGGPSFLGNRVAGVTSFMAAPMFPIGSYGDLNGMTRVSSHTAWITSNVPEPANFGLAGVALCWLWAKRRASANS